VEDTKKLKKMEIKNKAMGSIALFFYRSIEVQKSI